jgi:hypothetical protein
MCGNFLLAAGTNSVALPHDEEGPCAGHKGILFTFSFLFVLSICFSFLGIWGFLFSNYFFNYLSQESSIVVAGAKPTMSSGAQGGLPQARTTCQGSRACGRPGRQEEARSNRKRNS